MAVEPLDQDRRRQSDSTLPSMYTHFERTAREGEQFHRRHPSIAVDNISAASPVSPTTMYCPPPPSFQKYQQQPNNPFPSPPESRKNSEDEKRQLPSLREVGLAGLNPHHNSQGSFSQLPPTSSLPVAHSQGPVHGAQHAPQPQSGSPYAPAHQPPTPVHPSEARYDYHDGRGSYSQPHPTPVHPSSEQYPPPRSHSYSHPPPPAQYSPHRPSPPSSHSFSGPTQHTPYQFGQAPTPQQYQQQHGMPPPPPYAPPYHRETNGAHTSPYPPVSSPTSKVLGKRPPTGYGGAIERALHVSSMRRDLENSRDHSLRIYKLVQHLYEQNGSGYQNHGLEVVLAEFEKAVRDAEELKEGLKGCQKLLADMCKEERQSMAENGRPHGQEYHEVEEHGYPEDHRSTVIQQPEHKKVRRGRAAPPGRCHSCHRAETPEWRRGPDGARTLCNACGLHYAKLTRKMSKSTLAANSMAKRSPSSAIQ